MKGPTACDPSADVDDVQPPDATQRVAFVESQVRVEPEPYGTELGVAVNTTVGVAGGTAHEEPAPSVHEPPEQVNVAVPTVGTVVSLIVRAPPSGVTGVDPLQVWPPTVHDRFDAGHWPGDRIEHVEPLCSIHEPFEQRNDAVPVAGPVASVTDRVALSAVPGTDAEQLCPATVQFSVVAAQFSGAVHVAPACTVKLPFAQVNPAEPVVGGVASVTDVDPPFAVAGAVAAQVLPPIVQVTGPDGQFAPGGTTVAVQVPDWNTKLPDVQRKNALPVVGGPLSLTAPVVDPSSVNGATPTHVLPP